VRGSFLCESGTGALRWISRLNSVSRQGQINRVNRCIEIHDSRLSAVTQGADGVHIYFEHAYIHQSAGRPGEDAGTGWSQKLEVVVMGGLIEGDVPSMPCELSDGTLFLGDQCLRNGVPLPCEFSGRIELSLEAFSETECRTFCIKGNGMRVVELGPPRYLEEFKAG
jgi:hypothetical protein